MQPHGNAIPPGPQAVIIAAAANRDSMFSQLFVEIFSAMKQEVIGMGGAHPEAQRFQLLLQPLPLWGSKQRGRKKALAAIVEEYRKGVIDPENQRVAISHGDCEEEANYLAELIRAVAPPKELIIAPHEPFTGAHVGPGMLALFFRGKRRSEV